jgi:hypothetical protein
MLIAPSPTAEATCFTFLDRTSPTANTPGRTSLNDRAVAARKLEDAVMGKLEGGSDDPSEGILIMECCGMQVFSVRVSSLDGAGDGTRTRDVQLGKTTVNWN